MRVIFQILLLFFISFDAFSKTRISKNISYLEGSSDKRHLLDVYAPANKKGPVPVLVFIHGGSWNSGKKDTYKFYGKGFARKEVVTVLVNYRLSPEATYSDMAADCAAAVKWVRAHIAEYGGNPENIFVSGHSAGGHLAALISNDQSYLQEKGIAGAIKGCILIDAFGLDMDQYLSNSYWKGDSTFRKTFTYDRTNWKNGSPFYHVSSASVPQIIWVGGKTYTSISISSRAYHQALQAKGVKSQFAVIGKKKHIGMILQFINKRNELYDKVILFMKGEEN